MIVGVSTIKLAVCVDAAGRLFVEEFWKVIAEEPLNSAKLVRLPGTAGSTMKFSRLSRVTGAFAWIAPLINVTGPVPRLSLLSTATVDKNPTTPPLSSVPPE